MTIDYDVPFYANTPDDTHCFQAAFKMVLKYFLPYKEFSWNKLDEITAKQKNKWTWPMAGLCWLNKNGFEVVNIEDFDYKLFVEQKEQYLIDKYGLDIAKEQINHSVLEKEIPWVKKFIKEIPFQNRLPSIDEIKSCLDQGYLVIVNVNARSLTDREGYAGHVVVIKGYDNDNFIMHDPGLEPRENLTLSEEQFKRGWDYPDISSRNLIAIRPKLVKN